MPGASGRPPVYPVVGPAARSHRTRTSWSNEALPQTVEHVVVSVDGSGRSEADLVSLYVVFPRLRRGVALTEQT
jgi:hypothetical protein